MTLQKESTMTAPENAQLGDTLTPQVAGADLYRRRDGRPTEVWDCLCRRSS